jgi:hypothetical protein
MQKTSLISLSLIAALSVCFSTSNSRAVPLVLETFTYADGSLNGKDAPIGGVWGAHSGTASQVQVTAGQALIVQGGSPAPSEDVNVPFEGGFVLGAGGVLYAGFDLTVPTTGTAIVNHYFAHFLTGTTLFDARVWLAPPTTSGFRLAISNDNSITDADGEVFTGDLAFDTTYRIVTRYDFDAKNGRLWVNPVDESSASITAADPGFSDAAIAYAFRQSNGGVVTEVVDNLAVGTTFADSAVPEPSGVVLGGISLVGLLGILRARRKTA